MDISFNRPHFARRGGSPPLRTAERRDLARPAAGSSGSVGQRSAHRAQPRLEVILRDDAQPDLAPQQLTITRRTKADEVTLILCGELDLATAPALEHALHDVEASRPGRIVLDLEALEFIGSTGIHLLVQADERAQAKGHHFVLRHVPTHARRLLRLTGVDVLLTVE